MNKDEGKEFVPPKDWEEKNDFPKFFRERKFRKLLFNFKRKKKSLMKVIIVREDNNLRCYDVPMTDDFKINGKIRLYNPKCVYYIDKIPVCFYPENGLDPINLFDTNEKAIDPKTFQNILNMVARTKSSGGLGLFDGLFDDPRKLMTVVVIGLGIMLVIFQVMKGG